MVTPNLSEHHKKQAKLNADIEKYLADGGKVTSDPIIPEKKRLSGTQRFNGMMAMIKKDKVVMAKGLRDLGMGAAEIADKMRMHKNTIQLYLKEPD